MSYQKPEIKKVVVSVKVNTCTYRNNDADCLWKQERQ